MLSWLDKPPLLDVKLYNCTYINTFGTSHFSPGERGTW